MTEYNLKFKDLEEGKIYKSKNIGNKYKIIEGLLWAIEDDDWSNLSHNQVSKFRFKKIIKPSYEEKQFLSFIDDKVKWIARDEDGEIWLYNEKPYKGDTEWYINSVSDKKVEELLSIKYFKCNLDFILWEDEEPIKINDLLK